MPVWLAILIPIFTVSAGVATQFYFKWVPDIAEQKRHVNRAGDYLFKGLMLGIQVWGVYFFVVSSTAVTKTFVVIIAAFIGGIVFSIGSLIFTFFINRMFASFVQLAAQQMTLLQIHGEVFRMLAADKGLPDETVRNVEAILTAIKQ